MPDKIGNLFKTKDKSDRKYSKGGRLQEDEKYCYYYDAEGNLVFKEFKRSNSLPTRDKKEIEEALNISLQRSGVAWQYNWNGNGMLASVVTPHSTEINFYYDPLGRRTAKLIQEKVYRYVWDGNLLLHEWEYEGEYPPNKMVDDEGIKEEAEPTDNIIT